VLPVKGRRRTSGPIKEEGRGLNEITLTHLNSAEKDLFVGLIKVSSGA
jgi:hypothetical protein